MRAYNFPQDFWWGSAASGPQTEGRLPGDGKGDNVWDHWFQAAPEKFFDGIGPGQTSQVYTKFREDVALMKATGHNSFRTSIQWSRLLPKGTGAVNPEAVKFYNAYIDELLAQGIEPFINLHHFDLPWSLQAAGGWLNRETVEAYVEFAKTCFTLFGDRVKKWFTFNEPIVPVEAGYLYQFHYPLHTSLKEAVQVGFHECLASALAVAAYRELKQDGEIGVILNLSPSYPRDENNPADCQAAHRADLYFNRSFLDPALKGSFPPELIALLKEQDCLPVYQAADLTTIKDNTIGLLGVNYYQPRRVKVKETPLDHSHGPMPEDYFDVYDWPAKKINPYRGWEIYEKGLYDLLIDVRDNYDNFPCFISENGMGVEGEARYRNADGVIEDDYRITFIKDHLRYLHQALAAGCNVRGYHVWTCMDNWSWTNAYKNRYGLISVDLEHDASRTIKKSGHWFKQLAEEHGFTD